MIVIKPKVYFAAGNVVINERAAETDLGGVVRRLNRRPTIDGGVFIDDFGFSDGDRTIRVVADALSPSDYERVKTFVRLFGLVDLLTDEGVFEGGIQVANNGEKFEMTFLVKGRIDGQ